VLAEIKKRNIPVILGETLALPLRKTLPTMPLSPCPANCTSRASCLPSAPLIVDGAEPALPGGHVSSFRFTPG
jgi:hypothetical protein